jgi:hypothetical protein
MTKPKRLELADYIRDLTETHTMTEHYTIRIGQAWEGRDHRTRAPALIAQLLANDVPSAAVEEGPRPGFASKPAARLDAIDAAVHIDREVNLWITDMGEQTRSLDTMSALRQLHGLAAGADQVTRKAVERDARRWWTQARIVTGWDSPAWTPDNTCPQCSERGSLKVKLADHIAMCTGPECRTTWTPETIGLLADHIRAESERERLPRLGIGPCWCPLPKPVVPDLSRLCPGCGSARCRHALGARLLDTIRGTTSGRMGA